MAEYHNISTLDSPCSPFSHVVEAGGLVCLSGQVAADSAAGRKALGDIAAETRAVMESIGATLAARGLKFADVIRAEVYLVDFADRPIVDAVYARYFPAGRRPARTCVEVSRLSGGSRIEITVMALRPAR